MHFYAIILCLIYKEKISEMTKFCINLAMTPFVEKVWVLQFSMIVILTYLLDKNLFRWTGGNFWYIFWVDFKLWWLLFLDNGKNCQIFLLAMNEGNISTESAAGDYLTSNMRFVTELWQNTFHKKKKWKN